MFEYETENWNLRKWTWKKQTFILKRKNTSIQTCVCACVCVHVLVFRSKSVEDCSTKYDGGRSELEGGLTVQSHTHTYTHTLLYSCGLSLPAHRHVDPSGTSLQKKRGGHQIWHNKATLITELLFGPVFCGFGFNSYRRSSTRWTLRVPDVHHPVHRSHTAMSSMWSLYVYGTGYE